MKFLENEDVLDRLNVQYNQEGFPEGLSDSYDDSYDESYDETYDDSSAEFLPIPLLGGLIGKGIGAVSNLLNRGGGGTSVNLTGVNPLNVATGGIAGLSNLAGTIHNAAGRPFPFTLPASVAEKKDIEVLKRAVDAQNANIKRISDAVNKNAQETAKIAAEVNRVDSKHTAASKAQNTTLSRLNSQTSRVGKRVNGLGRSIDKMQTEFKDFRQQSQMMSLFPLLLQKDPEISSITFAAAPTAAVPASVTNSTFTSSNDSTMLLLVMMMSGGFSSSSSGSGGDNSMMSMLPLILLMK